MSMAKTVSKGDFRTGRKVFSMKGNSKVANVGTYIVAGLYNLLIWTGLLFAAVLLMVGMAYIGVVIANALLGAFGFVVLDFITMFSGVVIAVFMGGIMIFFYAVTIRFIFQKVRSKMWHVEKENGKAVLVKGTTKSAAK